MRNAQPEALAVGWDTVVLVCRQCRKRSSGPEDLKTRDVAAALRRAMKDAAPRPRVVLSSCLGPCPKRAMSVAVACSGEPTRVVAVRTLADVVAIALPARR